MVDFHLATPAWRQPTIFGMTTEDLARNRNRNSPRIGSATPSIAEHTDDEHTGRSWAQKVEDDPWLPLILSMDGGGIRGYSSLLIMKQLMHYVAMWESAVDREERDGPKGKTIQDRSAFQSLDTSLANIQEDDRPVRPAATEPVSMARQASDTGSSAQDSPAFRPGGATQEFAALGIQSAGQEPPVLNLAREDELGSGSGLLGPRRQAEPDTSGAQQTQPPALNHEDGEGNAANLEMSVPNAEDLEPLSHGHKEWKEEELLPCHYFDFMYGTSTGGLIGTMLGRLRMSVPQCLEVYRQVGNELFGKVKSRWPLFTKYDHEPLEAAVKEIVKKYCKSHPQGTCTGEDLFPWDARDEEKGSVKTIDVLDDSTPRPTELPKICQSICLTAVHNSKIDIAHLLRTYDHRYYGVPNWITLYNEGADKLRIWEVTRATSAAPFYFKTLEADIKGETWAFKDGGIRENNPAGAAWNEFVSLYGESADPALLLSVGTGRPNETNDGFATAWPGPFGHWMIVKKIAEKLAVLKHALVKYTEGEEKHQDMKKLARGEHKWYKRLNVSTGLGEMKLDDWRAGTYKDPMTGTETEIPGGATLTRLEELTKDYLVREYDHDFDSYASPRIMLQQIAEKMVRTRRAREKTAANDPERWDTYMGRYLTGGHRLSEIDAPIKLTPVQR